MCECQKGLFRWELLSGEVTWHVTFYNWCNCHEVLAFTFLTFYTILRACHANENATLKWLVIPFNWQLLLFFFYFNWIYKRLFFTTKILPCNSCLITSIYIYIIYNLYELGSWQLTIFLLSGANFPTELSGVISNRVRTIGYEKHHCVSIRKDKTDKQNLFLLM